ncbi:helix-turn-helix domain-containing protein [Paraliobacillus sediminis]|uniref:helix-turn-helix domain-containing protein n=1 Tax=Paraliobacillus sediminis TaxID=1885916 RepID=UPI000E3D062C|nr:helix-turn-helix transcriptional regulator [Paraliobacillus sediminis]
MDGKRLRELRNEKKLTQSELGKIINVSKVSVSGYESGDRTPDTDNLRRLADYFGVTSDYLLGRSDNPNSSLEDSKIAKLLNDPKTDLMFKDWKNMNEEQREEAINMIKYIIHKDKKGE